MLIEKTDEISRNLRDRAKWLESRSFAEIRGNIEREAADAIDAMRKEIERLREGLTEIAGHSVCCDARHCADRVLSGGPATIEA